ncbi:MAG: FAD-dependent oxidoreductase, partial [Raoultibacter sp.]
MRENERFLSRRSFLAGTGVLVGGVGLSTAAACLAPKSALAEDQASSANTVPESVQPIDPVEPPAQWDGTANVIVVGTGGSGGAAIVSALEAGASVIALEKNSIWGGHMQFSTGRGLPGATPAETFASEISAPYPYAEKDPLIARHIAEVINTDFEWLAGMLAEADITITTGMNFPFVALCAPSDYVEPANTTKLEEMAWHQWFPFNAKGYSIAFQKKANALGADIHYSTAVTALVLENDKVVGVRASDQEGTELFFKGSVVLCSGGYSANDDLLHHYLTTRKYKSFNKYAGLPSATGDGIRMAQGVNAALI